MRDDSSALPAYESLSLKGSFDPENVEARVHSTPLQVGTISTAKSVSK